MLCWGGEGQLDALELRVVADGVAQGLYGEDEEKGGEWATLSDASGDGDAVGQFTVGGELGCCVGVESVDQMYKLGWKAVSSQDLGEEVAVDGVVGFPKIQE